MRWTVWWALALALASCGERGAPAAAPLTAEQRAALVSLARAVDAAAAGGPSPERTLTAAEVVVFQDMDRGQILLSVATAASYVLHRASSEARIADARDMPQTAKDIRAVAMWKRVGITGALTRGDVAAFEAAAEDLDRVAAKGWPIDDVPLDLRR